MGVDIQRIIMQQLRRGTSMPEIEKESVVEELSKGFIENVSDWAAGTKQRRAEQVSVGNTVLSQGNQIIESLKHQRDGTMTGDNVTSARNKIENLKNEYIDKYPDAITNIDVNTDRLFNILDNKADENAAFYNVSSTLKNMEAELIGKDEDSTSMYKTFQNLNEESLLERKDEFLSKLSTYSANLQDIDETIYNFNLNTRIGGKDISNQIQNIKTVMKTFSNQFLLADSGNEVPVFDAGERRGLNAAANGDFSLLPDINIVADTEKKQDAEALQLSIEKEIENWNVATNSFDKWKKQWEEDGNTSYDSLSSDKQAAIAETIQVADSDGNVVVGEGGQGVTPKVLQNYINGTQSRMDADNKIFERSIAGKTYYESNRYGPHADVIANDPTLREIFNVAGESFIKKSKFPPKIPPSSTIEADVGGLRYKEKEKQKVAGVGGAGDTGIGVVNNIMKISPGTPGSNVPNQKDFDEATKDLSGRQKSFLKQAYRKQSEIDKLLLQASDIMMEDTEKNPNKPVSKKVKSKILNIGKRVKTAKEKLSEFLGKYENSLKGKKERKGPTSIAKPISEENIGKYLKGGSGESDFSGK